MPWTEFWDMHSGGDVSVEPYEYIYIEAPLKEAVVIFENRFARSPYHVTCSCCGVDYSIRNTPTLLRATAYHRRCPWNNETNDYDLECQGGKVVPLEDFVQRSEVLVIPAIDIQDHEREGVFHRPDDWDFS